MSSWVTWGNLYRPNVGSFKPAATTDSWFYESDDLLNNKPLPFDHPYRYWYSRRYKNYSGPLRDRKNVAVIITRSPVYIKKVDNEVGINSYPDFHFEATYLDQNGNQVDEYYWEIPSGIHAIEAYYNDRKHYVNPLILHLNSQGGKTYVLGFRNEGKKEIAIFIKEQE